MRSDDKEQTAGAMAVTSFARRPFDTGKSHARQFAVRLQTGFSDKLLLCCSTCWQGEPELAKWNDVM